jgi:hypothetical protein
MLTAAQLRDIAPVIKRLFPAATEIDLTDDPKAPIRRLMIGKDQVPERGLPTVEQLQAEYAAWQAELQPQVEAEQRVRLAVQAVIRSNEYMAQQLPFLTLLFGIQHEALLRGDDLPTVYRAVVAHMETNPPFHAHLKRLLQRDYAPADDPEWLNKQLLNPTYDFMQAYLRVLLPFTTANFIRAFLPVFR